MRSDWQDQVRTQVRERLLRDQLDLGRFEFIDPRSHGQTQTDAYSTWDLLGVKRSDVVLAYAEAANPTALGLAVEVGYARAAGKTIILVDEKSPIDPVFARYAGMIHHCADVEFQTLDEAINFLYSL
jgi:nucleoside 2-deoxyribosyltransferase